MSTKNRLEIAVHWQWGGQEPRVREKDTFVFEKTPTRDELLDHLRDWWKSQNEFHTKDPARRPMDLKIIEIKKRFVPDFEATNITPDEISVTV